MTGAVAEDTKVSTGAHISTGALSEYVLALLKAGMLKFVCSHGGPEDVVTEQGYS